MAPDEFIDPTTNEEVKLDWRKKTTTTAFVNQYFNKLLGLHEYINIEAVLVDWANIQQLIAKAKQRNEKYLNMREVSSRKVAAFMSVNARFQARLLQCQAFCHITPQFPGKVLNTTPSQLVQNQMEVSNEVTDLETFYGFIYVMLASPFQLWSWREHVGLLVSALFFGLHPSDVFDDGRWEIIWDVAKHNNISNPVSVGFDLTSKLAGAMLVISFLSENLAVGERLPESIKSWIDLSEELTRVTDMQYEQIPTAIYEIDGSANIPREYLLPQVFVRLDHSTGTEELDTHWSRMQLMRSLFLRTEAYYESYEDLEWRNFQRDILFYELYKKHSSDKTSRKVYEPAMLEFDTIYYQEFTDSKGRLLPGSRDRAIDIVKRVKTNLRNDSR